MVPESGGKEGGVGILEERLLALSWRSQRLYFLS